jgi:hypothetical protein
LPASSSERCSAYATAAASWLSRMSIDFRIGPGWWPHPSLTVGDGRALEADLVTTGPYRLVRHPIDLGLSLLAMGDALAFSSWPALLIVLSGIGPTFAWRVRAEETLLRRTFGKRYALYQDQTRMIFPYLHYPCRRRVDDHDVPRRSVEWPRSGTRVGTAVRRPVALVVAKPATTPGRSVAGVITGNQAPSWRPPRTCRLHSHRPPAVAPPG